MEERTSKIWSILSSYMQSSAECMSKLLNFINSHSVNHEMEQANSFIFHIEVLFNALDEIETKMRQYKDNTGLELQNEPRELVKKIIYFFSTISHSTGIPHDYTKEFLSLITLLAQTLKLLIRAALNCSIKLVFFFFFFKKRFSLSYIYLYLIIFNLNIYILKKNLIIIFIYYPSIYLYICINNIYTYLHF